MRSTVPEESKCPTYCLRARARAAGAEVVTEGPCSCSAPFDRIAEINFNIEADEDSVSDGGLLQGCRA